MTKTGVKKSQPFFCFFAIFAIKNSCEKASKKGQTSVLLKNRSKTASEERHKTHKTHGKSIKEQQKTSDDDDDSDDDDETFCRKQQRQKQRPSAGKRNGGFAEQQQH